MATVLQIGFSLLLNVPTLAFPSAQAAHHPPLLLTPIHPLNFSSNVTSSGKPSLTTTPSPKGIGTLSAYSPQAPSLPFTFTVPIIYTVTFVTAGLPRLQSLVSR